MVQQQIVEKTDGVPLFVEELTKAILESGFLRDIDGHYELTEAIPAVVIPPTLQDSLMARLDRLATAKDVAHLAATIGRQFSYALLEALTPLDEPTLQRALRRLVEAELLVAAACASPAKTRAASSWLMSRPRWQRWGNCCLARCGRSTIISVDTASVC